MEDVRTQMHMAAELLEAAQATPQSGAAGGAP